MFVTTVFRAALLGLVLMVAAGAAQAQAAQDCQDTTLTAEARQAACEAARVEANVQARLSSGYLNAGRPEDALVAARRAVELDPMYDGGQAALLAALVATGAVDEAIAAYREAQAAGLEDTAGHMADSLAWALYLAGEHEKALPIIEEWLAARPELTAEEFDHYQVGTSAHIHAAMGQTEEAVQAFLRAVEIGGPAERAFYDMALRRMGFAPEPGDEGFEAALRACVATGEECKFFLQ